MELRKLEKLPAEFRSAASLAIATANEVGSPLSIVKFIRQAFQSEYWDASVNADDATEYVLWLLISETRFGRFRTDWAKVMRLTSLLDDLT